ncbi:MAG: glycosyl hydrolase family 18 protein, partial [Chloroflexota bacterium]
MVGLALLIVLLPLAPVAADEPTASPDASAAPTASATPSATPTPTPTPTPDITPTAGPSPTVDPAPTVSPSPTSPPTPTPVPTAPPPRMASPEIFGWLPYWDLDATIDYGAITTIAYFGLGATADGHLNKYDNNGNVQVEWSRWKGSRVTNVISEAHANDVRVVLTIERFAWTDGGKAATRALLGSPEARQSLAAEIAAEIQSRGVDGVNLDFEPLLPDTIDQFGLFMNELRVALDAIDPTYQLTFATTGSQRVAALEMYGDAFARYAADALVIMGYPLRDIEHNISGGLAPYTATDSYDLKQIVNTYLDRDIRPQNVILALPWYGRDWPTVSDAENARVQEDRKLYDRARNIGYVNSLNLAIENGRRYDSTEHSAWVAYRTRFCLDCPETWSEAYYEDVDTLKFKYDWAVNTKQLRGVGIWAVGYDDTQPEMWKALRVVFRGLNDTAPPTGTFAKAADELFCTAPRVRLAFNLADGANGSGAVFVRMSNVATTGGNGLLTYAMTFPAAGQIPWSLDNTAAGGSSATGQRKIYAQWRDVSGNWSGVSNITVTVPSLVATGALTVAGGLDVVTQSSIQVRLARTGGGRTISEVRFSSSPVLNANGSLTYGVTGTPGTDVAFSLINAGTGGIDVDGRRSVYAQWKDSLGCWSPPIYGRITLDRAGPVGSLAVAGGATLSTTGDVQLLAPAIDAGSGVVETQLSNNGVTWQSFTPTDLPIPWTAGATVDGLWTISARWRDGIGNWSSVVTTSLTLDRNGPQGTLLLDGGAAATAGSAVTVTAGATEFSGV